MASTRRTFTFKEKMDIISRLKNGENNVNLSKEFHVNHSTISMIWKNRLKIMECFQTKSSKMKKDRKPIHQDIENALLVWYKDQRSQNLPVNGRLLQDKANHFATLLGKTGFKCSASWIFRFRQRNNIGDRKDCGEAASEPMNDSEINTLEIEPPTMETQDENFNGVSESFPNEIKLEPLDEQYDSPESTDINMEDVKIEVEEHPVASKFGVDVPVFIPCTRKILPKINMFSIVEYLVGNPSFRDVDYKKLKTDIDINGEDTIGFVQLHILEEKVTLQGTVAFDKHSAHVCIVKYDNITHTISYTNCECQQQACQHVLAFLLWLHRRCEEQLDNNMSFFLEPLVQQTKFLKAQDMRHDSDTDSLSEDLDLPESAGRGRGQSVVQAFVKTCEDLKMVNSPLYSTPPDTRSEAINITESSLPKNSKEKYLMAYQNFIQWKGDKNTQSFSENLFMAYFNELSSEYKPSSLWCIYSMLKNTVRSKNGVDLKAYSNLTAYLKRLSDGFRGKKSKVLSPDDIEKFIKEAPDQQYLGTKVALIFGVTGACKRQELTNITVKDIENQGQMLSVKISNSNSKIPRSFKIHSPFYQIVKKYDSLRPPNAKTDRFFLNYQNGKCTCQPIGVNKFGSMPKEIAKYLGFPEAETYTGHSFRRTSYLLADSVGDLVTLKGHGRRRSSNAAESCDEELIQNMKEGDKITKRVRLKSEVRSGIEEPQTSND